MPLVKWVDKMSVGVAACDEDHKKVIGMINKLFDSLDTGKGKDVIDPVLAELKAYASEHFAREERFFEQTDYPGASLHKAQHKEFIEQILEIQQKVNNRSIDTLPEDMMGFLANWFIQHICVEDKKYTAFLNDKGIK